MEMGRMQLAKSQGFWTGPAYDVSLERYATGEYLLSAELSGTIMSRPATNRIETGGREWGLILERLESPYVRILGPDGGEWRRFDFWNGRKTLYDAKMKRKDKKLFPDVKWPCSVSYVLRDFPADFIVAAGYDMAMQRPYCFLANGPYEQMRAKDADSPLDIPVVMMNALSGKGRTVFVNMPPTVAHRSMFRDNFQKGQDALSEAMADGYRKAFAFLVPQPAVSTEYGTICAAYTERGDLVVTVEDDSPIYKDPTVYPVTFRFTVSAPGIGMRKVEGDADFAVVSRTDDRIVVRTKCQKDAALFFRLCAVSSEESASGKQVKVAK